MDHIGQRDLYLLGGNYSPAQMTILASGNIFHKFANNINNLFYFYKQLESNFKSGLNCPTGCQ